MKKETTASDAQSAARETIEQLFLDTPLPTQDVLFNLGLYVRGSLLAKFLVLHEVYKKIKNVPGAIMEFGVWWGQNMILLENLRAIHEPMNKQRRIIGFDTFEGYPEKSNDIGEVASAYATTPDYITYLQQLLEAHEGSNVLGHANGQHDLIVGDVTETASVYFAEHPETIVAFAYIDIGTYEATAAILQAIKPNVIPGSVLLLDELTWADAPGEAIAFKEIFSDVDYTIETADYYASKAIVTVRG